jgi:hypothetical protein
MSTPGGDAATRVDASVRPIYWMTISKFDSVEKAAAFVEVPADEDGRPAGLGTGDARRTRRAVA